MAATVTVDRTISFVKPFVNWANLSIGDNNEPAVTAANLTLETIEGPPFVWPWNRSKATFLTSEGTQDYNAALYDFGFLESVTIQAAAEITAAAVASNVVTITAKNNFSELPNGGQGTNVTITGCTTSALNGTFPIVSASPTSFTFNLTHADFSESESGALALAGPIMPLEIKWGTLGEATEEDRPTFISTQESDESGVTFTFRLLPVPDQSYQVNLTFQKSPVRITATSQEWGIPDQLQYLYTYFYMFFMLDYFDDTRAARYRQLAVAALLARQSGLSDTDKNLFLGSWLPLMNQEQGQNLNKQQATQARGI